jgi:hypothetical protein
MITAIGWWALLLFSMGVTGKRLIYGEPVIIVHFIISFALLLVAVRATRRYFYFKKLRH